jgi:hypothetical protein
LIIESGLAPVATSRGLPKFPIRYTIAAHLLELAPTWPMMQLDAETFELGYVRHLNRLGIEQVMRRLSEITAKAGADGVVLCCFEPVGKPCHRHLLGRWIAAQTAIEVHELPASTGASTEPPAQQLTIEEDE